MIKYKVGDKVKIRKDSQLHDQAPDLIGEIIQIHEGLDFPYRANFSNGYINCYRKNRFGIT